MLRLEVNLAEIGDLAFFKHAYRTACLGTKVLQIFDIDLQFASSLIPVSSCQVEQQQRAGILNEVGAEMRRGLTRQKYCYLNS